MNIIWFIFPEILKRIQELNEKPIKHKIFNQARLGTITDKATKADLINAITKLPQRVQASSVFERDFDLKKFAQVTKEDHGTKLLSDKPRFSNIVFRENIHLGQLILEPDKFDERTLKTALTSIANKYFETQYDKEAFKVVEMIFLLLEEEIDQRKVTASTVIPPTSRNELEEFHGN